VADRGQAPPHPVAHNEHVRPAAKRLSHLLAYRPRVVEVLVKARRERRRAAAHVLYAPRGVRLGLGDRPQPRALVARARDAALLAAPPDLLHLIGPRRVVAHG